MRTPFRTSRDDFLGRESLLVTSFTILVVGLLTKPQNFLHPYTPLGLTLICLATLLATISLFRPSQPLSAPFLGTSALVLALTTLCTVQVYSLPFQFTGLVLCLTVIPLVAWYKPRLYLAGLPLLALVSLLPLFLVWKWGSAPVDLFGYLQGGTNSLLHGQDPYSVLYPTGFNTSSGTIFVAPAHIQYSPIILLLDLPARILGDIRLTSALAVLITWGSILILARHSGLSPQIQRYLLILLAVLPITVFIVAYAFIDVEMMAAFALWLLLRPHHPRLGLVALALAIGIKVTVLLFLIPFFLWLPRVRREIISACLLVALAILPFLLWSGWSEFWSALAGEQFGAVPRVDSLSLLNFFTQVFHFTLPGTIFFLALALATFLTLRHRPTQLAQLLIAGVVISLIGFLLSKGAFINYYYDSALVLLLSLAVGPTLISEPITLLGSSLPPSVWINSHLIKPSP